MEEEYKGKIAEVVIEEFEMDPNAVYEIKEIQSQDLLNSKRIDIIVKLKYIENIEKNLHCQYYNELYKKHIDAFTGGTFTEWGNEEKNSIDKYIHTFNKLIENIKKYGFDENRSLVPVGKDNIILDGSHRTSIAMYYHKPLKAIILKDKEVDFGANYFRRGLLNIPYVEYMVTEYCKLKENVFVFCIWPKAERKEAIEKKITENTNVIYSKEIELTYNGYRNLMIQIYGKDDWSSNIHNHFKGIDDMIDACYKNKEKAKIYIVEGNEEKIIQLKEEFDKGKNGSRYDVYTTNSKEEAIGIVEVVLNQNSIRFLNTAKLDKYEEIYKTIQIYKQQIEHDKLNPNEFVVDSDSVLAIYGLKDEKNISFLSYNNQYKNIENDYIKCNNEHSKLYKETIVEIVNNPKFYFYFWNVKFVDLKLVKRYKKNHLNKEEKKAIRKILHKKDFKYSYCILKNELKRLRRNYTIKIKKKIKNKLKKLYIIK